MKKIIVCGAGGFIGTHLVNKLKKNGHYVIGADLKYPEFSITQSDEFFLMDLRDQSNVRKLLTNDVDEIYQLAADMGGAGYIFNGENDANIMYNSAIINLNILNEMVIKNIKRIFYSSSACIYPLDNQQNTDNPILVEGSAYPANPDSEYGWEKLFSERVYMAYAKNYNIDVRIARLHNVFGPYNSWNNGKEKSPAALCRKIAECIDSGTIEIWGTGNQTRSFLFIDECIEGICRIMNSDYNFPLNLGSDRMISINDLAIMISKISNKKINIKHIHGPIGVMGRNSDNNLIKEKINWAPIDNLEYGIDVTYQWIADMMRTQR